MRCLIKTIPHNKQRTETIGDYWYDKNHYNIRVSDLGNEDFHFIISVHELIEMYLTKKKGIYEKDITKFDIDNKELDDPGRDSKAPYHKEHMFCDSIDILLCDQLGIDYNYYMEAEPL